MYVIRKIWKTLKYFQNYHRTRIIIELTELSKIDQRLILIRKSDFWGEESLKIENDVVYHQNSFRTHLELCIF